jgi:hypothetical protein
MSQQLIDLGSSPTAGDGDSIRVAFNKTNLNFTELYGNIANLSASIGNISPNVDVDGFAAIAFSGLYSDLIDPPVIPTIPGNVGAFYNNVGYITNSALSSYATKNYVNLAITTALTGTNVGNITLAQVATSGLYSDLIDVPVIPEIPGNISAFYNDSGYVNSSALSGYATTNYVNLAVQQVSPVNTVAGRTGNVVLTVNDIYGAASKSWVTQQINSQGDSDWGNLSLGEDRQTIIGLDAGTDITLRPIESNVHITSNITVAGDAYATYFRGNGALLTGVTVGTAGNIGYGNTSVSIGSLGGNVNVTVANTNVASFSPNGLAVTGNVSANYFLGNGALLTGVITSVANINSGSSNVTVTSSGGPITVGVGGQPNIAVFNSDSVSIGRDLSVTGNITATGNVFASGNIQLGDSSSDNIVITGAVTGNIIPKIDNTYTVGDASHRWASGFFANLTVPVVTSNVAVIHDNESPTIITGAGTTVDVSLATLDTFDALLYRGAKYTVSVENTGVTQHQILEILLTHDGNVAKYNTYAVVNTGTDDLITITATLVGTTVYLRAYGVSAGNLVKIHKVYITI